MLSTNENKSKKLPSADSFDTNGTEGMLDVILGCTLIFILLSSLISADRGKSQEMTLPDIDLSKAEKLKSAGSESVKKTIISLKMDNGAPSIFLDNRKIDGEALKTELKKLSGIGHVALRRDQNLPCKWEDKIIMECRKAGINRVAIMVRATN
jgi:biopolymer transport protein ExbD